MTTTHTPEEHTSEVAVRRPPPFKRDTEAWLVKIESEMLWAFGSPASEYGRPTALADVVWGRNVNGSDCPSFGQDSEETILTQSTREQTGRAAAWQ